MRASPSTIHGLTNRRTMTALLPRDPLSSTTIGAGSHEVTEVSLTGHDLVSDPRLRRGASLGLRRHTIVARRNPCRQLRQQPDPLMRIRLIGRCDPVLHRQRPSRRHCEWLGPNLASPRFPRRHLATARSHDFGNGDVDQQSGVHQPCRHPGLGSGTAELLGGSMAGRYAGRNSGAGQCEYHDALQHAGPYRRACEPYPRFH